MPRNCLLIFETKLKDAVSSITNKFKFVFGFAVGMVYKISKPGKDKKNSN